VQKRTSFSNRGKQNTIHMWIAQRQCYNSRQFATGSQTYTACC